MRALLLVFASITFLSTPALADEPAPEVRAPDELAQEAYDYASDLRRAERFEEAAVKYEQLASKRPNARLAPRALASAAAIWQWDLGEPERARALYDRVIAGPADRPGVLPAMIQRLELEKDVAGPKAALALADRWLAASPRAEQAPFLLMRTAELLDEELGDRIGAIVRLERLLTMFPGSSRADEAQMRAAKLYRALGKPDEAVTKYRALMSTKSSSWIVGEYNSTKLDDAYFELAETYRLDLHDAKAAEDAYRKLVADLPDSRLVDDALFHAEALARARGDAARALRDHQELVKRRPGSRYLKPSGSSAK